MAGKTDPNGAGQLQFEADQVVQEWGYDDDVDQALRTSIESAGVELVDEDYGDVTDAALVWWRSEDGDGTDLADLLVDAASVLDDGGLIWVLVPKAGSEGHVWPNEIEEAARTAGLQPTSSLAAAPGWLGVRSGLQGTGPLTSPLGASPSGNSPSGVAPSGTEPGGDSLRGCHIPDFRLTGPNGEPITPTEVLGRPTVVLFVPGAFTPVCTAELTSHADAIAAISARLLVTSCDSAPALAAWLEAEGVAVGSGTGTDSQVVVASDFWPHGDFARSVGAFDENRGWARRTTLVLDGRGIVRWRGTNPGGVARDPSVAVAAVAAIAR